MTDIRRLFRWIGGIVTVGSACFTFAFGFSLASSFVMALLLAVTLACATIASAYVWPFVADSVTKGSYISAGVIALFGVLVTTTDVMTNFGSISWQRTVSLDRADVHNVKYDDKRAQVNDDGKALAMWQARREKLMAEKPWVATVSADGLRADLKRADEAVRQESNRGGCGPKCLKLMAASARIAERIASAEALSDIDKKIAATERLIAKSRAVASVAVKAESPAMMQNTSLASMFTLSRNPTTTSKHWTDKGVSWMTALFLAFGAMGANYLGWWGLGTGTRLGAPPAAKQVSSLPKARIFEKSSQPAPASAQPMQVVVRGDRQDGAALLRAFEKRLREGSLLLPQQAVA